MSNSCEVRDNYSFSEVGDTYSFSEVVTGLKEGFTWKRLGWHSNSSIKLHHTHKDSDVNDFIYMFTEEGYKIPWVASQTDILSNDWIIIQR